MKLQRHYSAMYVVLWNCYCATGNRYPWSKVFIWVKLSLLLLNYIKNFGFFPLCSLISIMVSTLINYPNVPKAKLLPLSHEKAQKIWMYFPSTHASLWFFSNVNTPHHSRYITVVAELASWFWMLTQVLQPSQKCSYGSCRRRKALFFSLVL